jgi:hypothetical protein
MVAMQTAINLAEDFKVAAQQERRRLVEAMWLEVGMRDGCSLHTYTRCMAS